MTSVPVSALGDIDPSIAAHAVHYEATSFGKFSRAMEILAPRYEGFTFVDLGSGKGRVLLLAALRPFRRVIGVEISASLHTRAQANVEALRGAIRVRAKWNVYARMHPNTNYRKATWWCFSTSVRHETPATHLRAHAGRVRPRAA